MSKPVGPKLIFFVDFVGKVKMCLQCVAFLN